MSILSHDDLIKMLHYAPESGVFTWKVRPAMGVAPGSVAGTTLKQGYRATRIRGVNYRMHRLAFFYMTRRWPVGDVDHIDCDKANNRWSNLREATRSQNLANRGATQKNSHGNKGLVWDARRRKWRAVIVVNYRRHYLGIFDDIEEAKGAYWNAAQQHFGEFARR